MFDSFDTQTVEYLSKHPVHLAKQTKLRLSNMLHNHLNGFKLECFKITTNLMNFNFIRFFESVSYNQGPNDIHIEVTVK